jgi:5-methylcytosine-specific restriction endonuclease McrA
MNDVIIALQYQRQFVPAMHQHPGTCPNLDWRSGMFILTDKKLCTKCGEQKNKDEFYTTKTGLSAYCKICTRQNALQWQKDNPEKHREHSRTGRLKRYWNSPDKYREAERLWKARHPDKRHQDRRNRRAREKGSVGTITTQEWQALKEFYCFTCLCCGKQEPEIELTHDHVKPLVMGGENTIENSQPLCGSCNRRKGARWIDYR